MRTLPPEGQKYLRIAQETEDKLRRHVLAPWFPRAVDHLNGGFHQNYNEDWSRGAAYGKSIVYQSRLTWVASQIALRYPSQRSEYLAYCNHGIAFLTKNLWDGKEGGPFWAVDNEGLPLNGGEKHSYGIAFSIYALTAGYRATKDAASLEQAKRTFQWLDSRAHDAHSGGYFEALLRSGQPILESTRPGKDMIGTPYGEKSMNAHIHLLEAFTALFKVWPNPHLRSRLREVFLLVRDRVAAPDGHLTMFFAPDWQPASQTDSYGHDLETAYLLQEAATALGETEQSKTARVSRRLADHALLYGLDRTRGGFYDSGPANSPAAVRDKIWWTQAEALNTLLRMHQQWGNQTPQYWQAFQRQWEFIKAHQIDTRNRGWYPTLRADGSPIPGQAKSDAWTDPYHQARALMNVSDTLHQLAAATRKPLQHPQAYHAMRRSTRGPSVR